MTIVISVPKPLQKNPDKNHYIYKYIFIYIVNYFTLFSSNLPAPNMTLSFVIFVIFFFISRFLTKITSNRPKIALLTFP